jgi:hypothetical protein
MVKLIVPQLLELQFLKYFCRRYGDLGYITHDFEVGHVYGLEPSFQGESEYTEKLLK